MEFKFKPRRTISFNERTLHISLPSQWCKNHNVKIKDYVEAKIDTEGNLIISPQKNDKNRIE